MAAIMPRLMSHTGPAHCGGADGLVSLSGPEQALPYASRLRDVKGSSPFFGFDAWERVTCTRPFFVRLRPLPSHRSRYLRSALVVLLRRGLRLAWYLDEPLVLTSAPGWAARLRSVWLVFLGLAGLLSTISAPLERVVNIPRVSGYDQPQ